MTHPSGNRVVVSQPMYFPWVGQLQQVELCNTFVYYDDVQFVRGFFNRVQIKTKQGIQWLTAPLSHWKRGQLINEIKIDNSQDWRRSHLDQLKQAYLGAPYCADMLSLVESVFARPHTVLADLAIASTEALIKYYPEIEKNCHFLRSSTLQLAGTSSQRLINICSALRASSYLTGHGASNYLDHAAFEAQGIPVEYIDYVLDPHAQLHGAFTPYVSALDLIANCGPEGISHIAGRTVGWRGFMDRLNKRTPRQ